MKLINLVFQGITAREETYDFGNKAAGCIVLQDADKNALKEALSFAFYGSVDPTRYTLPLVVSAKFMLDDIEYDLTRALVREPSGAVAEKVALSDLNTGVIYGEGKEDIDSYLLAKIGLDKDAFEKLLFVDEELTSPIAENLVTRESFVAEQIASLATSQKVIGKYNELKADEEAFGRDIQYGRNHGFYISASGHDRTDNHDPRHLHRQGLLCRCGRSSPLRLRSGYGSSTQLRHDI